MKVVDNVATFIRGTLRDGYRKMPLLTELNQNGTTHYKDSAPDGAAFPKDAVAKIDAVMAVEF